MFDVNIDIMEPVVIYGRGVIRVSLSKWTVIY
jgi:hypothetical protein